MQKKLEKKFSKFFNIIKNIIVKMPQKLKKKFTKKSERLYPELSEEAKARALKELVIYYKIQKKLHHPNPPQISVDEEKFQKYLSQFPNL